MLEAIWKFVLEIPMSGEGFFITAPRGVKPLHVGKDPKTGATCIWGKVDTQKAKVKHRVNIYGTGHELAKEHSYTADYIGTIITAQGLVWHYFLEVKP